MSVNSFGQNPWQPAAIQDTFIPDQLIAGNTPALVTETVQIASGKTYQRGTVLGLQSLKTATSTVGSTNSGDGTLSGLTVGTAAEVGAYLLTATSATEFSLTDPTGASVGTVTVGTAFAGSQLGLLLTAGATAFAVGDKFTLTVSASENTWVESVRTATDGSQVPAAILVDYVDATEGTADAGVYVMGAFNVNRITYDASWDIADLKNALRPNGIFIRSALTGPSV